ncbi:MAG: hypothetical protein HY699_12980 [Deltaproteobacteria bacterium]|nr:hypothetical protein [Deltaproteobacteria bacterium]
MATRTRTTRHPDRPPFETSPERIEAIRDTLDAMCGAGQCVFDSFEDAASLRSLAKTLRLPYLQVQLMRLGTAGLTEADVDEYNTWRASLGGQGGGR